MKLTNKKTMTSLIAFCLMSTIAITIVSSPITYAHYPAWQLTVYAYVSVQPSLIGVGQAVDVVFWTNEMPRTASGEFGDRWIWYVDVMNPDGTNKTLGPYKSDPVGTGYLKFTPDMVGTYTFVSVFPQQKYTGLPTRTGVPSTNAYVNDTLLACRSDPVKLTVQEEKVIEYNQTPLPTEYWTRPVYGANNQWGLVTGNWLSNGDNPGRINSYSTGPETAHIMWTREYWSGGLLGGEFGSDAYYQGMSYEGFGGPNIIINGQVYYSQRTPPRYGWYALDLRTGEEQWWHNSTGDLQSTGYGGGGTTGSGGYPGLSFGQVLTIHNPNQHGGFAYLWSNPTGNTWDMFDAFTGNYICSIANASTSGTQFVDKIGSTCYVSLATSANIQYLRIWNTTHAIWWRGTYEQYQQNGPLWTGGFSGNNYWTWRPTLGNTFDGRMGFSLNKTVSSAVSGSITEVLADEYIIGGSLGYNDQRGSVQGNLWSLSLKSGEEGQVLWNRNFTMPRSTSSRSDQVYQGEFIGLEVDSKNGVFLFVEPVTRTRYVYSLDTMTELWSSQEPQWNFYSMRSSSSSSIYEGKLLSYGYGGVLNAYDLQTGDLLWNWTAPDYGLGTTFYEHSPLSLGCIADGNIYLYSTEHSPSTPLRLDAHVWCVDAETGKMHWDIQAWPTSLQIADGYVVYLDLFDNRIYSIGKGPSAIEVTASPKASIQGTSVVIEGTVTDQSAGAKSSPAIADEYMSEWMAYLYQQRPFPADAKGVEVTLDTLDPNGNLIHLGNATCDNTGKFGFAFVPEVAGTYRLIATFEGSASYGSSYATTYINVADAPQSTLQPTPLPLTVAELYFVPSVIVIIVVIIAVGLLIMLMLRKRP
jgi:hypothetical protein